MIAPAQSRAARGLLGWSQAELAERSNLSESTLRNFEAGRSTPSINNLAAIERALKEVGVVLDLEAGTGPGVRFKRESAGGDRDG